MKYLSTHKIDVNLSVVPYLNKIEAKASYIPKKFRDVKLKSVKTCCFREYNLTPTELLTKLVEGYNYAHIFKTDTKQLETSIFGASFYKTAVSSSKWNKGALLLWATREDNFKKSSCIFVDVDKTSYKQINDFIQKLYYYPTFAYSTPSDVENNRRFRLVYVFETPITDSETYTRYATIIKKMIENSVNETLTDDCWLNCSQKFLGSYNANYTYCSNIIYNFIDFENYNTTHTSMEDITAPLFGEGSKDYSVTEVNEILFDKNLLLNIVRRGNDLHDFAKWNWNYSYITRNTNNLKEGEYKKTSDEIVLSKPGKKIKRGFRLKVLKQRAALRRVMTNDNITPNLLLFNLWMDRILICEYFEDITVEEATQAIKYVLSMTMEQIKQIYKEAIIKQTNKKFIAGKGTKINQIGGIISEIRKDYITKNYNPELNVEQNCKLMGVSKPTLIKWMKEKGIDKQSKIKNLISKIKKVYNPELSIIDNYNSDEIKSMNISLSTFKNYIKQI